MGWIPRQVWPVTVSDCNSGHQVGGTFLGTFLEQASVKVRREVRPLWMVLTRPDRGIRDILEKKPRSYSRCMQEICPYMVAVHEGIPSLATRWYQDAF